MTNTGSGAITALDKLRGWRRVEDDLPPFETEVCAYGPNLPFADKMAWGWRISDGPDEWFWALGEHETCDPESVTHWMPLPEPPKHTAEEERELREWGKLQKLLDDEPEANHD